MKSFYLPIAVGTALLLSGCDTADSNINSSDSEPLLNIYEYRPSSTNSTTLSEAVKESITKRCGDAGGLAIYTGFDENSDGQLLEDEYSSNSPRVLCNGKETIIDLVENGQLTDSERLTYESQCPTGGAIFRIGIDDNDDNQLDGSEHYSTEFVCDGVDGSTLSIEKEFINSYTDKLVISSNTLQQDIEIEIEDGVTPTITTVDIPRVGEAGYNGLCFGFGGQKIIVSVKETTTEVPICNGTDGKDADDALTSLKLDYNSSAGSLSLLNGENSLNSVTLPKEQSVQLTKVNSGSLCQFGGLTLQNWLDVDGDGTVDGNEELGEESTLCNPSELNATAPTVTAVNITNPQEITFSFSEPINPATLNSSTVFLDCNSSNIFSRVNFDYTASTVTDFNLTTDNNSTPLDYNTSGCKFVITDYIEDINGTRLAETNVTNLR
jgi:hypothetical protein